jgi:BMFP domain-containing protein YqiC
MMKKLVQGKAAPEPSEDNELEQLRARLAELESQLKKKEQPPKERKPSS